LVRGLADDFVSNFDIQVRALGVNTTLQQIHTLVEVVDNAGLKAAESAKAYSDLSSRLVELGKSGHASATQLREIGDAVKYVRIYIDEVNTSIGKTTVQNRFTYIRDGAREAAAEVRALVTATKESAAVLGRTAAVRTPFQPTVLSSMTRDAGLQSTLKLDQQRFQALNAEAKGTIDVLKKTEEAFATLANNRAAEGLTKFADRFRTNAEEVRKFREEVEAAVKAGVGLSALNAVGKTGAPIPGRLELQRLSALPPGVTTSLQKQIASQQAIVNDKNSTAAQRSAAGEAIVRAVTEAYAKQLTVLDGINAKIEHRNQLDARGKQIIEANLAAYQAQQAALAAHPLQTRVGLGVPLQQTAGLSNALGGVATAQALAASKSGELNRQIGNFYPLIVAAGLWHGLSRATLGLSAAAIKTAADYQTAFASVARTTTSEGGDTELQIEKIRQSLLEMSTTLPTNFQGLSEIATAGNQLGIPAAQISDFTQTVAKFSAVSNESADETAKSFGALSQILGLNAGEYRNLASSITLVGRTSVATESEVLKYTTRIGSTAHQVGFTTQQTVGLAAALASVREPMERSQGALEKFFKVANTAAATGGPKLDGFAKVLHTTSAEAAGLLKSDPYTFFKRFLDGLHSLDSVSRTTTLAGLGLNDIRVSEVVRRLADNMKIVNDTQKQAATGFASGTDLSTQYAKATDTLAAKFMELQNAVANVFNSIGSSPVTQALAPLVDTLKGVVVGFNDMLKTFPGIAAGILVLTTLLGVIAALRAAMFATAIASYALEGAQIRLGGRTFATSIANLVRLMFGLEVQTKAAATSTTIFQSSATAAGAASEVAAVKTGKFAGAMRLIGAAAPTLGMVAFVVAIGAVVSAMQEYNDSISGSFSKDDLASALAKDQAEFEKHHTAIRHIATATNVAKTSTNAWVKELQNDSGTVVDLNGKTTTLNHTLEKNSIAFGKAGEAATRAAIGNNTALQSLYGNGSIDALKTDTGFDPKKFDSILARQGGEAAKKYLKGATDALVKEGIKDHKSIFSADYQAELDALKQLGDIATEVDKQQRAAADAALTQADANSKDGDAAGIAAFKVETFAEAIHTVTGAMAAGLKAQQDFAASIAPITQTVFGGANAYFAQTSALQQMGAEFANTGSSAAFAGQGMQSYIDSVANSSSSDQEVADHLQELVNAMVAGGYVAGPFAASLSLVRAEITALGGSTAKGKANIDFFRKGIADAQVSGARLKTEAQKTADALDKQAESAQAAAQRAHELADKAQDAANAFRTTADYANDLSPVLQRAFDIQFGPQQARDSVAKTFNDMRKSADDAKKSVADARKQIQGINADIAKLAADNAQQGAFLGVANAFGDQVAAAQIQATMAKNSQDIADKQSSKRDAYRQIDEGNAQLDTATSGNSDAALRNRATLTGLVGSYQSYISALATSGASQKEIAKKTEEARKNFISQGTALGFSKRQLTPYSNAMKGFIDIVKKVPRKVSVEVKSNVSAAQNTLREFYAKLKLDNAATGAAAAAKFKDKYAQGVQKAAQDARKRANAELSKIGQGIRYHIPSADALSPKVANSVRYLADSRQIEALSLLARKYAASGAYRAAEAKNAEIARLAAEMKRLKPTFTGGGGTWAKGGYTGPGGQYQPAGIVHKGEYVVPKYLVNQQTGLPYADALGRLISGTRTQSGYAGGGFVNPDGMMVELGPRSMRLLREAVVQDLTPVIEPRAIAGASQDYRAGQRRRGSTR
jgi:TP901 family phage tail tape measure protein